MGYCCVKHSPLSKVLCRQFHTPSVDVHVVLDTDVPNFILFIWEPSIVARVVRVQISSRVNEVNHSGVPLLG
jgi:hypothetical protein